MYSHIFFAPEHITFEIFVSIPSFSYPATHTYVKKL